MLDIRAKEWGWTAIIPGFSLLADEFTEPYLKVWELQADHAYFKPGMTSFLKKCQNLPDGFSNIHRLVFKTASSLLPFC